MNLYDSLLEKMGGQEYQGYFMSVCPFHDDHSPSLMVHEDGYKCKACGAHGNLKKLELRVRKGFAQKSNIVSVVLPRWKAWEREYGDLQGIAEFAHDNLLKHKTYRRYYENRKCQSYIKAGRLGYLSTWAVIPVFGRDGQIVDIVVRSTRSKDSSRYVIAPHPDSLQRPLFCPSWKRVINSDVVYVVYGIFDAISLELCGFPVVTGITGKSLSPNSLSELHKKFIIVPDWREEAEAHKLANALGWRAKVKELSYPDGTKDCDDIRRQYGESVLKEMLEC